MRIYDINSNSTSPTQVLEGHSGNVTAVGFQKDSRWLYSGSEDGTVKIWDLRYKGRGSLLGLFDVNNVLIERQSIRGIMSTKPQLMT